MHVTHQNMANAIRALAMDAVQAAKSGHPGMPMGIADVATVLFTQHLKFHPQDPQWPDRDRFVLSAGHGSMLLYAALHLLGYKDFPLDELKKFRQLGSATAGHPEFGEGGGIETTTGPLGQGLATAVGMALAEQLMTSRFGSDLFDHHTYVIASDGDLMEGISHEAIALAGHLNLSKLIVLFDDNGITIDGPLSLSDSTDQLKRFEASGWSVTSISGHDPSSIGDAITAAKSQDRPSLIACKTTIGFGSPNKSGKASSHGAPLGPEEVELVRQELNWPFQAFDIPEDIRNAWRSSGERSKHAYDNWADNFSALAPEQRAELERVLTGKLPPDFKSRMEECIASLADEAPKIATRAASQKVLEVVNGAVPETIGGSADLTGSNNTNTSQTPVVNKNDFTGRFIHFGIREHAMAAAMNGMALHGGLIPYSGTFLVFSDYCRPAIRLSALMKQRVIYVMTHDSIGLGEDGPTHQPVEHLAALRAIPNLNVFRPADAVETAECWQIALEAQTTPSVIALSRQALEPVRVRPEQQNLSSFGAYEARPSTSEAKVSLFATGSEVAIALKASDLLEGEGIATRVVSMPCWELFEQQSANYRQSILGASSVRIGVEAAVSMGWERYLGTEGGFIGMTGFGASAPYQDAYDHFGITPEAVAQAARARL